MNKIFHTTSAFILLAGLQALATPAQVILIRHGEKPDKGNQVSPQGCQRAFSLPPFVQNNSQVNAAGPVVAIYAMAPASDDGTIRCIQVVAPTAKAMNLKVNDNFVRKEYDSAAKEILSSPDYDGKTVLVSWEHTVIRDLAVSLGLDSANVPKQDWPDEVYDQAWILSFKSAEVSLNIVPEYVLPTDNPLGGLTHWVDGPQTPNASSPVLSNQIQSECINNNALNTIVKEVTSPALTDKDFAE